MNKSEIVDGGATRLSPAVLMAIGNTLVDAVLAHAPAGAPPSTKPAKPKPRT